jgi:hypothetical protein
MDALVAALMSASASPSHSPTAAGLPPLPFPSLAAPGAARPSPSTQCGASAPGGASPHATATQSMPAGTDAEHAHEALRRLLPMQTSNVSDLTSAAAVAPSEAPDALMPAAGCQYPALNGDGRSPAAGAAAPEQGCASGAAAVLPWAPVPAPLARTCTGGGQQMVSPFSAVASQDAGAEEPASVAVEGGSHAQGAHGGGAGDEAAAPLGQGGAAEPMPRALSLGRSCSMPAGLSLARSGPLAGCAWLTWTDVLAAADGGAAEHEVTR